MVQAPIEETLIDFGVTGGRVAPPEVLPHHGQAEVVEFERLPQASQTPESMTGSMPQFSRGTERGDLDNLLSRDRLKIGYLLSARTCSGSMRNTR